MARRALVTGAGGFVGANLCRRLLGDGVAVHALVRPDSDSWRLHGLTADLAIHEGHLGDRAALEALFEAARPEWVFHLAAHGGYSWQTDTATIFSVNASGSAQLADLAVAHEVESFIQTGSSSEYGFKDHPPDECEWVEPNSAYAVSKAAATLYARMLAIREDRHLATLRLYSVYGPWEDPRRLMPALAVRGLRGEMPPLVDPRTARDYVAADDVIDALIACARRPDLPRGSVYNVASGAQTSLGELVRLVSGEMGITVTPTWSTMAARAWDTNVWVGRPSRIEREIGWRARTTLLSGFRALVSWLRGDPAILHRYERAVLRTDE